MNKPLFFSVFLTIALLLVVTPAVAQNQEGSVEISKSIVPSSETKVSDFTSCVEQLVKVGIASKDATGSCLKASKIASKTATRVANEAADATKASRPMLVTPPYGYGYGYRDYYGYRYRVGGYGFLGPTYYSHRYSAPRYHTPRYHTPRYSRPPRDTGSTRNAPRTK